VAEDPSATTIYFDPTVSRTPLHQRRSIRVLNDTITLNGAQLDLEWDVQAHYFCPETFTEAEAEETLAEMLAMHARSKCMLIIRALPDAVVSLVLPQLEEIADYETRMWEKRRAVSSPSITERWVSLPLRQ